MSGTFLGISPRGGKTDICIFMEGQECFEKIFIGVHRMLSKIGALRSLLVKFKHIYFWSPKGGHKCSKGGRMPPRPPPPLKKTLNVHVSLPPIAPPQQ